ncbi:hypothetical protein MNBD_ALPHA09-1557 [hydrothermal vent metagenome]|uniref:DUF1674 domain-containing protein n=1 Tax=hydrothermal vent metagenome TaxID=652676 RepID=A0A3B0TN23_9ZZZZ
MNRDETSKPRGGPGVGGKSKDASRDGELAPAARRALAEAKARRDAAALRPASPAEVGGPDGPEPTRYGDWEKGGIASDF